MGVQGTQESRIWAFYSLQYVNKETLQVFDLFELFMPTVRRPSTDRSYDLSFREMLI